MGHYPINHSKEPIRLFKSDFLEFFTHIHPAVVVIAWLPVVAYLVIRALSASSWKMTPNIYVGFLIGLFIWTLSEYSLHRFLFHHKAKGPVQERIFFLFHGVHHAQPQSKTRLVMPLAVSIPMAAIFYGLFTLFIATLFKQPTWLFPTFAGFMTGYLIYDLMHFATHHFPMRSGYWKFIKRYHMQHHYKTPDQRFGVSSPLWDNVFGTNPGS